MIWAKEETLSREEIKEIQTARLRETVERVYHTVEPYRKKMDEAGLKPEDIRGLEDLHNLPFTTKQDMRDNYPFGLFAVPKKDLIRIHASSGTTGKPTVVGYTRKDLDVWSECVCRIACMGGAQPDEIAQICFGYGMFTGALGLHYGLERLGAAIVPSSTGNTEKQLMFMKDFGTTLLIATPSYALRIAEVAEQMGIHPQCDLSMRTALVGSELMTEAMRQEMYKAWGDHMNITQNYGMSELMGPGVSGECLELNGMHINEDHFIAEIIDPATGEVLPDGEKGELVFTSITKEAFPLLRYRTRDICVLNREKCSCGRTHVRMSKPMGRSDDMLIVKGVNVFPSQIETVLLNKGYPANYQIIVSREKNSDKLEVQVEMTPEMFSDSIREIEVRERELIEALKSMLGIYAVVKLVAPKTIARSEGKAKRVIDNRNLY